MQEAVLQVYTAHVCAGRMQRQKAVHRAVLGWGFTDAEFNEYAAVHHSRATRTLSSFAIRYERRALRSGGYDPSAYQWILPSEARRPGCTAARSRSPATEG